MAVLAVEAICIAGGFSWFNKAIKEIPFCVFIDKDVFLDSSELDCVDRSAKGARTLGALLELCFLKGDDGGVFSGLDATTTDLLFD
jgi:hypothetical protein